MNTILSLRDYCVSFGKRQILVGLNLDLDDQGVTIIMGPCGTGKSTLLRSLSGHNDASSWFLSTGDVHYLGELLGTLGRPILVQQKPKLMVSSVLDNIIHRLERRNTLDRQQQSALACRMLDLYGVSYIKGSLNKQITELPLMTQRIISIMSAVINSPPLLMIDEPTADLSAEQAAEILAVISCISKKYAVLVILHNQNQARELGGNIIFVAGGRIQECKTTDSFLNAAESEAGKDFVRTGTCMVPAPDTLVEDLDPEYLQKYVPVTLPFEKPKLIPFGPSGFRWLLRGKLASMPRPGLSRSLDEDMLALKKVNVNYLISLEEHCHYPAETIKQYDIGLLLMPIVDMQVPKIDETVEMIQRMGLLIDNGNTIAVHCKAGLGRTGTLLACYLIFTGLDAGEAITKVRCQDPRMIQSSVQEDFISTFYVFTTRVHKKKPLFTIPPRR
ncbi:MAG: dual specificity protein phosphatase family protein [Xanthomonadales bacterium]|nr:dual specificity protein phosphatase family protein [Xanthomonadales bacterium]